MTITLTLPGAAKMFAQLSGGMDRAKHAALEAAARMVKAEAKRLIGHQQPTWPALQPETIAHKTTGDSPLLETGEMRDSIEHQANRHEAQVGSNNDKAVWQELGTSRGIPPRSFLAQAALNKEKAVVKMIGDRIANYLAEGHALGDVLHEAKKALHEVKELVEDEAAYNEGKRE